MAFEKIKPSRIYHEVTSQIEDAIVSGELLPGDKLPAERELAGQLDVSRRTLRESFRVLEQKGLIEIKTGVKGGAFVRSLTTRQVSESLALLIRLKKVSLTELGEFRRDVEGTVTGRAAQRATTQDIDHLGMLLAEAEAALAEDRSDWKAFMDVDRRIHVAVARIGKNVMYELVLRTVHDNIHRYYESYLPKDEKILLQSHRETVEIVRAVERRDADKAMSLAQEHVQWSTRFMEEMARQDDQRIRR